MIKIERNDTVSKVKATAFNWVFTALISVVIWLVMDMHADLKSVLQIIPVMKIQIENLEDKRLVDRFRQFQFPKHEETITYDSLTSK